MAAASTPVGESRAICCPEVIADAAEHRTRGPRPRPQTAALDDVPPGCSQHPSMHISTAFQGIGVDTDVEHDVAHEHQVHGAHPTGGTARAQAPAAPRRARWRAVGTRDALLASELLPVATLPAEREVGDNLQHPDGDQQAAAHPGARIARRPMRRTAPAWSRPPRWRDPGARIGVRPQVGAVVGLQTRPGRGGLQEVVGRADPHEVAHQPVGR